MARRTLATDLTFDLVIQKSKVRFINFRTCRIWKWPHFCVGPSKSDLLFVLSAIVLKKHPVYKRDEQKVLQEETDQNHHNSLGWDFKKKLIISPTNIVQVVLIYDTRGLNFFLLRISAHIITLEENGAYYYGGNRYLIFVIGHFKIVIWSVNHTLKIFWLWKVYFGFYASTINRCGIY